MSVNRYTTESGLQTLANGQRIWIGTKEAYEAEQQAGTLPNDCLIAITNDDDEYKTDTVTANDDRVVTSGGVYNKLANGSLKDCHIKWAYMGANSSITLSNGTYLIFAIKPQWKKQAIFSVDKTYGIAELVNINNLTITKTDITGGGYTLTFNDTYMNVVMMSRYDFTYQIGS